MADTGQPFSGFYRRTLQERIDVVAEHVGIDRAQLVEALKHGGLSLTLADKMVENVLGTYALPFSLGVNFVINGDARVAPMVVEEPSVVAAASAAAKLIAASGGFEAHAQTPVMIAQVQVYDVPDLDAARVAIEQARDEILQTANAVIPRMVERGGGATDIEVRIPDPSMLVVHVLVDCRDAMGANLVNTVAEAVGPIVARIARARLGLRILSNLADHRKVRVRCRIPARELNAKGIDGIAVADAVEQASRFAECDPYRAATHNKGIMNGIDPVILATGNDWRAIEAGAHAYAARNGSYTALATWRRVGADDDALLEGRLELPMAVGTVGGTSGIHPAAQLALRLASIRDAADLAMLAACVGLASNLAALRALATEGIQRGHMSLHARSVAVAAGAVGHEVEQVALELSAIRVFSKEAAADVLARLRAENDQ